jgi:ABC-2 type transport system permease protein
MSALRPLVAAVWVGWKRDFGWTNPVTGIVLRTVGPIATVLSASIIYWLGASAAGVFGGQRLAYIIVGAALYVHISMYSAVSTMAIAEGKWSYVFAYVFISPRSSVPYLAGRTIATFATSAITSLMALTIAYYLASALFHTFPPLIITPASASMLALAMVLNIPATMGLGFLLGAYSIFASKFEWALPTYVQGILMVFSGALFPVSILPWPLSFLGSGLPFTEFIAASRSALIYGDAGGFFVQLSYGLLGGVVLLGLGLLTYRLAEKSGRRKGIIDKKVV